MRSSIALTLALAPFLSAAIARAEDASRPPEPPRVTVLGEASEDLRPDIAFVRLEIAIDKPTAVEASNENAKLSNAVIDGLKGSGVDAKDISTQGLSLTPVFTEQRDPKTNLLIKTIVTGYHAQNSLSVKVKAIDRTGAIIGTSVQNGALYDGVSFDLSDREARRNALRSKAAANAVHRAGLYAEGLSMRLGPARSLIAEGAEPPPEMAPRAMRMMSPAAPVAQAVAIEPGQITLSESVNATFELLSP